MAGTREGPSARHPLTCGLVADTSPQLLIRMFPAESRKRFPHRSLGDVRHALRPVEPPHRQESSDFFIPNGTTEVVTERVPHDPGPVRAFDARVLNGRAALVMALLDPDQRQAQNATSSKQSNPQVVILGRGVVARVPALGK